MSVDADESREALFILFLLSRIARLQLFWQVYLRLNPRKNPDASKVYIIDEGSGAADIQALSSSLVPVDCTWAAE